MTTLQSPDTLLDAGCFELTFAPSLLGAARHPVDGVVMHRTTATGPGGHPIYSDETGIIRAEISDRCEVRMLATSAHQVLRRPTGCRPLAAADLAGA